jgi:3-polyprenyl-4-hydroxybenzoate decarboxylase
LVVAVNQRYTKEGMKTALGLLGEGQLSLTKCLILVDPQVNVRDFHAVLHAIQQNFDPSDDFLMIPGVAQDTLDFTSFTMNLGSKMVIDATRKGKVTAARKTLSNSPIKGDLKRKDSRIIGWHVWDDTMLVVQVAKEGRKVLEQLVRDTDLEGVKIIAMVSPDVDLDDRVSTLWGVFTRFDCARDVIFTETSLAGSVARPSGRLGIDATFKPGYPEPLDMPEEIREKVTARWGSYGL